MVPDRLPALLASAQPLAPFRRQADAVDAACCALALVTESDHTDLVERFEARADAQRDDDNVMLTLTGSSWLLNVDATPTGWHRGLARVPGADPRYRADVQLGTSAGRPVWWSLRGNALVLTVGADVESGDVVVSVPATLLNEIVAEDAEAASE